MPDFSAHTLGKWGNGNGNGWVFGQNGSCSWIGAYGLVRPINCRINSAFGKLTLLDCGAICLDHFQSRLISPRGPDWSVNLSLSPQCRRGDESRPKLIIAQFAPLTIIINLIKFKFALVERGQRAKAARSDKKQTRYGSHFSYAEINISVFVNFGMWRPLRVKYDLVSSFPNSSKTNRYQKQINDLICIHLCRSKRRAANWDPNWNQTKPKIQLKIKK